MSDHVGKRIMARCAHGEWWEAYCSDIADVDGVSMYILHLDNGDVMKIPVEDITAILETKKRYKAGDCAVIPFRRRA